MDIWFKDKSTRNHGALHCIILWTLCLARNEVNFQIKEILTI
jgi:hypothetical protein